MVRGRVRERVAPATSERRLQRARTIGSLLRSVVSVTVWGTAFVLVLTELGLNPAPLIASAGVVGLAIGFGAQNLVRDFLSGMFMMLEDQYGVGDVIDVGEASGTVEAVGLRVTTLRDINGTVWYVRNGEVLRVGNSSQGHAVAVVDLPVGHNADTGEVIELLARRAVAAVAEEPLVSDVLAPPEVLGVEQVTAEGLMLRTTVQVRAGRQWAVQRQLRAQLKEALDEAGVEPPYGPAAPPSRGQ
jgi:small conductance mechanosensitive channel